MNSTSRPASCSPRATESCRMTPRRDPMWTGPEGLQASLITYRSDGRDARISSTMTSTHIRILPMSPNFTLYPIEDLGNSHKRTTPHVRHADRVDWGDRVDGVDW